MEASRESIKADFLKVWPLKRLKAMTIDEYVNSDREDAFAYWIEFKTKNVVGVGGGSAYKYGIYKSTSPNEVKNPPGTQ